METTIYAIVNWEGENRCGIINLKFDIRPINVDTPRIPLTQYKVGDKVKARHGSRAYFASIVELSGKYHFKSVV